MISGILALVFISVFQLALILHVRNTAIDCAGEGARYAAFADRGLADGEARTRRLLAASLSPAYARHVEASGVRIGGQDVIEVRVEIPVPVLGLLGPAGALRLSGHAVAESAE